ncbi:MAG: DinB family protein [Dehalococcoidia bacterium]|nr:DinB family protein [Dehalococcoidia bacterium]
MDMNRSALISSLKEARQELVDLSKSLSPDELKLPTRNEGWSVKDTLAHVASSEAGLVAAAVRIIDGQVSAKPGFDLHAFNQRQVEKRRESSMEELLAELEASRAEAFRTLERLTDEQLCAKGCLSSGTPTDVLGVFKRICAHEQSHCQDIRSAIGKL